MQFMVWGAGSSERLGCEVECTANAGFHAKIMAVTLLASPVAAAGGGDPSVDVPAPLNWFRVPVSGFGIHIRESQ